MEDNKEKRIHIIVPPDIHKEIKQFALNRNISVSKYVIDAVMARIRSEKKYE